MKKKIIICGYPKSGNTWLTQLTAEIIGCPVAGFWCEPFNNDMVIEGKDRTSDFLCFKSHNNITELQNTLKYYGDGSEKIIYIIRNPFDIVISASNHFSFSIKHKKTYCFLSLLPYGKKIYNKLFISNKYKHKIISKGIIEGTDEGAWLNTPWKSHVEGYLKSNALIIRYEDLIENTYKQAKIIVDFIGIEKSSDKIQEAIKKQSFSYKKEEYLKSNSPQKANFLRKGEINKGKNLLSKEYITYIEKNIGVFLKTLNY